MRPAHTHMIIIEKSPALVHLDKTSGVFEDLDFESKRRFSLETGKHIDCRVEIKKWSDKDKTADLLVTVPTDDTILYLYFNRNSPDNLTFVTVSDEVGK
jgi:hypothetical protein